MNVFLLKLLKQKNRGMSLTEVMVAIFIMLIAITGFTYLFLSSWKTNKFVLEEGLASAAASRTTNLLVSELRRVRQADNGDFPLESGGSFDLKAYLDVDRDGVTERVHYFLEDQQLKKGVTEPTGSAPVSYPAADDSVTVLADYVTNTESQPIFYYYNGNYPGDAVNNPLATPVVVGNVKLVRVRLFVNIDPINAPNNVVIESFVYLRNLVNYE